MVTPKRYYIDTNVLVNYAVGHDVQDFHESAERFLEKVEDGTYEGILSPLTILEYISVVRRILANESHVQDTEKREEAIREAISFFIELDNVVTVKFEPNEVPRMTEGEGQISSVFVEAYNIILTYNEGRLAAHGKYKFLSAADAIHLVLADLVGCDGIASFDKDFENTEDELEWLNLIPDSGG